MNRASAKAKGSRLEKEIATYLAAHVNPLIERRAKSGSKDRGDITGLTHMGGRIVVEIKNQARTNLAGWVNEAEIERGNDDAMAAVVVHKRHGVTDPGSQWVTMTLANYVAHLNGELDFVDEQRQ